MYIHMLRQELVFIENFGTNFTWKRFCDDSVHGPTMSLQVRLIRISSVAVFPSAFIRLFSGMNLK